MSQHDPAYRLDIYLLGPARVIRDGKPVTGFRSSKAQALLYFIAMSGGAQRRSTLAGLFWPEANEKQAGASLRNALSNLRTLVGHHLTITREAAILHGEGLWLDVAHFEALLKRTGDGETDSIQQEAAASLYRSDFLAGFHIPDAPEFEQWATIERERLRQAVLNALLTLAEEHSRQADFAASLEDLNRLLAIDPANEAGHRQKMLVLAQMGQRSAALQQYELCRLILAEELGVEPSPETTALHELIIAGALEAQPKTEGRALGEPAAQLRSQPLPASALQPTAATPRRDDRREMPERIAFHGRQEDLAQLRRWLTTDEARLVAVSGMGGIGKTALAVELVASLAPGSFDCILWRSLVNAPPPDAVLDAWLQSMVGQQPGSAPEGMDDKLSMLFAQLQRQRCLLVLDNLESVLEPSDRAGQFRSGYEAYGQLIERMGQSRHRSCLLLTTRDLPKGLRTLEEDTPRVRILPLEGLPAAPAIRLLRDRGVSAPDAALAALAERYSGNPLALKLVADTVRDLFGNDMGAFLGEETPVFESIRKVLDDQYGRLNELCREVVTWLAIERMPVTVQTLWANLARPPRRSEFLEVVRLLQNSSLVEISSGHDVGDGAQLALQNVVMEYLTDRLVTTLSDEIEGGRLAWLHRYALVKAHSNEHIQQTQRRLLLAPVARRLVNSGGRPGIVERLRDLLTSLRREAAQMPSYAAANILHLLRYLETDLNGWDFSGLVIRQADLRTGSLAGVNFRGADLVGSTFAELFGMVSALAISPDGRFLAAGDGDGRVLIWRMPDLQSYFVLEGHTHAISALAFSPDGAVLASGSFDGRICLWNAVSGELLRTVPVHTSTVGGVAFSPDGAYLASGGGDRRIIIWDWRSGEICRSLQETASVDGVTFTPDDQWLISVRDANEANVWDWRSGTIVRTLCGHQDKLRVVACSSDGVTVATGGEDKRICLWQLDDPGACRTLDAHNGWILALAFSPDGESLASAGVDRTVRLWDAATGQLERMLLGHSGWVKAVAYSPDGTMLASGGYDQAVRLWETRTGLVLRSLHGYQRRIYLIGFGRDGALLVSSSLDGPVNLWDVRSRRHLHRLTGHRGAIRALALSGINEVVAGGCDDHRVYLWDVHSGRLARTLTGHTDFVRHVAFSRDGHYLITGSYDRTLRIWEAATGRLRHVVHGAMVVVQSAFCSDGRTLAYSGGDHTVKLLDISSGKVLESVSVAPEQPVVVACSPQRRLLACGTDCGALWVWQMNEAGADHRFTLRFRVQPMTQTLWRIFFSEDGKWLADSGSGGIKHFIDVESGEIAFALPDVSGAFDLAFGGEGGYLAAAGPDATIQVRDAATGEIRRTLAGHLADVTALDVSPAEHMIASGSVDGAVRLWDPETGACLATLEPPGPYAEMNIAGATGLTQAQRATLIALGAVED